MKINLLCASSRPPEKRCGYLLIAALLPVMIWAEPKPAFADSDIENVVGALALTVASIRVVSESCQIYVDPMLEARIFETVAAVPRIRMTEVTGLLVRSYKNELHLAGRECSPGDADRLPTLTSIYDTSLNTLRDLVNSKTGN